MACAATSRTLGNPRRRDAVARLCSRYPHPRRQCRRPEVVRAAIRASRTAGRMRASTSFSPGTSRSSSRFHGYPRHHPQADLSPTQSRQHPCARLQGRRHPPTTPFDMVVLNNLDRFQLALDAHPAHSTPRRSWLRPRRRAIGPTWSATSSISANMATTCATFATGIGRMSNRSEMEVLALNSGSSSLKFGLYRVGAARGRAAGFRGSPNRSATPQQAQRKDAQGKSLLSETAPLPSQREAIARIGKLLADTEQPAPKVIGHRIVHGGPRLRQHCVIDEVRSR